MRPKKAQYLLRFDDLCPTMNRRRWQRFLPLIEGFDLQPILAVVPDNHDSELEIEPAYEGFWDAMRGLAAAGATIGLHGYQHLCVSTGRSLIPMHGKSEFAGVSRDLQKAWIQKGLAMLRSYGLEPKVWVAPRHGLDWITVEVLREVGLDVISDGFAREPFRDGGATWIPQQVWGPVKKESGLWTICLHSNSATDAEVAALEAFLKRNAAQFTSVDRVLREWPVEERSFTDRLFHECMVARMRVSQLRRGLT